MPFDDAGFCYLWGPRVSDMVASEYTDGLTDVTLSGAVIAAVLMWDHLDYGDVNFVKSSEV